MTEYYIPDIENNVHFEWSQYLDPIKTVDSGDIVELECRDASNGYINENSTMEDLLNMEWKGHPLTGPIEINELNSGDVLKIEILSFEHHNFGFTYFYPPEYKKGLFPDLFDDGGLFIWEISGGSAKFVNGIEVLTSEFPGCIGVAPDSADKLPTTPPRNIGGNLDVRYLTKNSILYLPVPVDGGYFSIGDCHAAQGDGEICVTGIEAPMTVRVRLSVEKQMKLDYPQFVPGEVADQPGTIIHGTVGIAQSLREASVIAMKNMIEFLISNCELTKQEAYILCSVAVNLKINQLVNAPNVTVSAILQNVTGI